MYNNNNVELSPRSRLIYNIGFNCSIGLDITFDDLNKEYMETGLYFPRNRDIDGKRILIVKSKLHIRGLRNTEQLIRGFVYWVERLNRYITNQLHIIPSVSTLVQNTFI